MRKATLIVQTPEGQEYDLSRNLLSLRWHESTQSFCSSMTAVVLNPNLPYQGDIQPGCTALAEMVDFSGRGASSRWKLDALRRTGSSSGAPGTIVLEGRGLEAELLDTEVPTGRDTVLDLDSCPNSLLRELASLAKLQSWQQCGASVSPPIQLGCRLGIAEGTVFEILRDVADHLGYGFVCETRHPSLTWTRPDQIGRGETPTHVFVAGHGMRHVSVEERFPPELHRHLDDWY